MKSVINEIYNSYIVYPFSISLFFFFLEIIIISHDWFPKYQFQLKLLTSEPYAGFVSSFPFSTLTLSSEPHHLKWDMLM